MIIKDPKLLSHDDLIEALVYTNCSCNSTAEMRNDVRNYYKLLSREELEAKISGVLYKEDKGLPVTMLELKRREIEIERYKPIRQRRSISSDVDIMYISRVTPLESFQTELLGKSWVRDAVMIAPGVIGIRLEVGKTKEKYDNKIKQIAIRCKFEGDILYG